MKKTSSGAKADNLELLINARFNVPKFYVVSADVKNRLDNADYLEKLGSVFESWLSANNIKAVAVRSSSTLEDSEKASFAGQFETVLDVKNKRQFVDALSVVLSSKQSKSYSEQSGAVYAVVQEFIEPDISGVIFSVNPANGSNEIVINATRGRGTNVVEGKESDQYFINRFDLRYVSKLSGGVDAHGILSDSQIQELSLLALQIETLFGIPQDVEWAIKDKDVFILQARPITRINHLRLWDSSNLAESFPGIVLPLTFSIAKRGYLYGYKSQAYAAGLSWYELEKHHRISDAMVGIFNGRMYYNLLNWYKFIALFPGSKRNQGFLDAQIATQGEAIYQPPAKLSFGFRLKFIIRLVYRALFFSRELKRFYKRFESFEAELSRMPKAGDSQTLMEQYTVIESIVPHFGRTVDNDFFVMTYHGWMRKLLTRWLPDQDFERNTIIGSIKGVLSAEQALSLYEIAKSFKADKAALDLLSRDKYELLDKYLANSQLRSDIAHYIEVFGHRFAEDQKIESINPTLEQFGMYKLIKAYVQLDSSEVNSRLARSDKITKRMENMVEAKLSFYQKLIYKLLLRRLKHHLRIREKNRLLRGKVYGYLRVLFPKVGEALVNEGILNEKDDIYYLQIDEIYQLLQASLITNDLPNRIKQRRKAYKDFAKIPMPERFITTAIPSLEKIEVEVDVTSVSSKKLPGLISSPGTIVGRAIVLDEPHVPDEPYDILITRNTDPGWTPLIALAKGVVVEHGGMLSHAAIITRELGIPSIIGVQNATTIVKTGMRVRINTQTSSLEIID